MYYCKHDVSFKEFMMHDYIYNLSLSSGGIVNVPKIINYDVDAQIMTMENIPHMCVADFYGESASAIDEDLFARIRAIIRFLYSHHIIYPDITGYNFIEWKDKLWIIDFEHTDFSKVVKNCLSEDLTENLTENLTSDFVKDFVENDDYNEWNPDFR